MFIVLKFIDYRLITVYWHEIILTTDYSVTKKILIISTDFEAKILLNNVY